MTAIQKIIDTATPIHVHIIHRQEVLLPHALTLDHLEDPLMVIIVQVLPRHILIVQEDHLLLQVVVLVVVPAEETRMIIVRTVTAILPILTIEVAAVVDHQVVLILLTLQEDITLDHLDILLQVVEVGMEHLQVITAEKHLLVLLLYSNIINLLLLNNDQYTLHQLQQHLIHLDIQDIAAHNNLNLPLLLKQRHDYKPYNLLLLNRRNDLNNKHQKAMPIWPARLQIQDQLLLLQAQLLHHPLIAPPQQLLPS